MSLIGAGLAVVDPLLDGFIFFPCVVTSEGFHTWEVRVTIEDLVLLLKNLKSLLSGFIFVCGCLELLEEGLLTDDIFVLFYNICMSGRQTLNLNYLEDPSND